MKPFQILSLILIFFLGFVSFSQTAEQQKIIEKAKKMQDSIMNTAMFKELQQINDQEEARKKAKKEEGKVNVKQKINYTNSKPKLENYEFGELEVAIMVIPLGMKKPIKIGTMAKSGDINFDFPIALKNTSQESSKIRDGISSLCDKDLAIIEEKDNVLSHESGIISLWTKENRFVGDIYAVSDEDLIPWIDDPFYASPILGSYYKLVYVASDFQYNTNCTQVRILDEGNAKITYTYNLNLKSGFNFVEYRIEHIHKKKSNDIASFPDKVSITSVNGIPTCQWIGQYF
ncbi:hypothetical protein [Confluentibacter sediminis]|uniref:hypothetical protein n=1 Tax=Confluentibacter sediminis TaxID=2219045 RepID=UPI000DAD0E46|nr:hypothetical protein [Confluentibacter sediminis]